MTSNDKVFITNAHIVLEDSVLYNSSLLIEHGRIADIECTNVSGTKTINANKAFVLPGFVDLHCDAIEKEIEVRPGVLMPLDIAIIELDKKVAMAGITTIFHSISFAESDTKSAVLRTVKYADQLIKTIREFSPKLLVDTRIHLRYEITCSEALCVIEELLKNHCVDLLSIMDHTPGQGQFKTFEQFFKYYGKHFRENMQNINEVMRNKIEKKLSLGLENAKKVTEICKAYNVALASHDDDSKEKIDFVYECGASISEFPMSLEAAKYAKERGLMIIVGAPNILRGESHNGNLSAIELIKLNLADIISSDYMPGSLIYAFWKLYKSGLMSINNISKMFSLNPAKAIKLDRELGKIEKGFRANLILLDLDDEYPRVIKTIVDGTEVYSSESRKSFFCNEISDRPFSMARIG
ncbi:MAG: alpha-D-ribose 1-methylphosphonate 5-triphosphate diphosphatase [Deltaproteobacteria bacterium]|nr:alpha-D-ribose 1-methylphosphonate 5-triphosphate diphosphatase [Deltaproteobacteria bacterium]